MGLADPLATVPKLAVNGVARFAVLRWAVHEDDDECLQLRLAGSLQAEQPCQLCGVPTRLYPLGLNFALACEKCCHDHGINATTLYSSERWEIPTILYSPSMPSRSPLGILSHSCLMA